MAVSTQNYTLFNLFVRLGIHPIGYQLTNRILFLAWINVVKVKSGYVFLWATGAFEARLVQVPFLFAPGFNNIVSRHNLFFILLIVLAAIFCMLFFSNLRVFVWHFVVQLADLF